MQHKIHQQFARLLQLESDTETVRHPHHCPGIYYCWCLEILYLNAQNIFVYASKHTICSYVLMHCNSYILPDERCYCP